MEILKELGINACLAVGKYFDGNTWRGHAWVTSRLGMQLYTLESTNGLVYLGKPAIYSDSYDLLTLAEVYYVISNNQARNNSLCYDLSKINLQSTLPQFI